MTSPPVVDYATIDVCALWASPDDMLDCCPSLADTSGEVLEWALTQASDLLYNLSGHRWPGICDATVRPCGPSTCCIPASDWRAGTCCCCRTDHVRLAGYPVQEIVEITIDGEIVPANEYRVDRQRELVRLADTNGRMQSWPSCQRLDIAGGVGTFVVTYRYGLNPPLTGSAAAAQLACEIAKQCPVGTNGASGDCKLPAGTVRVARQGITVETQQLGAWLLGSLRTGLAMVDSFIAVYGGQPRRRRTALLVPEMSPWPLRTE